MYKDLEQIRDKCLKCEKCPLSKSRHNVVFSDGRPNPKLMLIGEAPGYWEDMKGLPFVGKAGQLLDKKYLPLLGLLVMIFIFVIQSSVVRLKTETLCPKKKARVMNICRLR